MTSRELEYIKTVADEKSISSAARKLYIAQPSLSQSLQRIEENLGAKLFNRTPSGLTLTMQESAAIRWPARFLRSTVILKQRSATSTS